MNDREAMSEVLRVLAEVGWITKSMVDENKLRIDYSEIGQAKAIVLKELLDEISVPPTMKHMKVLYLVLSMASEDIDKT